MVPDDERVTVRPMFGSVAAFADGHMFMGLVRDELFFRLDEPDRDKLLTAGGRYSHNKQSVVQNTDGLLAGGGNVDGLQGESDFDEFLAGLHALLSQPI